jgi:hypothetical protein
MMQKAGQTASIRTDRDRRTLKFSRGKKTIFSVSFGSFHLNFDLQKDLYEHYAKYTFPQEIFPRHPSLTAGFFRVGRSQALQLCGPDSLFVEGSN